MAALPFIYLYIIVLLIGINFYKNYRLTGTTKWLLYFFIFIYIVVLFIGINCYKNYRLTGNTKWLLYRLYIYI